MTTQSRLQTIRKRSDFVASRKGAKWSGKGFLLVANRRTPFDTSAPRVGFTVTKKTGNAVERNRMKRRLREICRLSPSDSFHPGYDYVLIARREALSLPFDQLMQELARGLDHLANKRENARKRNERHSGKPA